MKSLTIFVFLCLYSSQSLCNFLETSAYSVVNPLKLYVHKKKKDPRPFFLEIFELDQKSEPSSRLVCSISHKSSKPQFKENCSGLDLIFKRTHESNSYTFGLLIIFLKEYDLRRNEGYFSLGSKKYKIKIIGGDVDDDFKKMKSKKINLESSHLELFSKVVNLLDIGLSGVLQAEEKYKVKVALSVGSAGTGFHCKLNENQKKALILDNKEVMKNVKRIQKVISKFQLIGRLNESDVFDSHDPVHYVFEKNSLFERFSVAHTFRSGYSDRYVGVSLRLKEGKDCREDLDIYK